MIFSCTVLSTPGQSCPTPPMTMATGASNQLASSCPSQRPTRLDMPTVTSTADRLVRERYDFEERKKIVASEDGFSRKMWKELAELGPGSD